MIKWGLEDGREMSWGLGAEDRDLWYAKTCTSHLFHSYGVIERSYENMSRASDSSWFKDWIGTPEIVCLLNGSASGGGKGGMTTYQVLLENV
jgi:hypothetical protein